MRDLDVVIGVDLRLVDPQREVEGRVGRWLHRRLLDCLEDVPRHLPRGAVDARAGDRAAPVLGALAGGVERRERLAVEPALADVGYLILDARLVLGRANAGRIYEQPTSLHVVEERVDEPGVERVGIGLIIALVLSGMMLAGMAPKNCQARSSPSQTASVV